MPSFRRRAAVVDADRSDEQTRNADRSSDAENALALAEEAEAEAAEAEAMAAAARVRARAIRLRREAQAAGTEGPAGTLDADVTVAEAPTSEAETPADVTAATDVSGGVPAATVLDDRNDVDEADLVEADDAAEAQDADETEGKPDKSRWRRLPRPSWKGIAATLVILCTLGLLGVSGYMVWHHREADKVRQQNAEYTAAGRQSVMTLMSLDFNNAQRDVQRIIDNSTGQFKSDFEAQAKDFVKVAEDSKVVTEVTVNSVGVQSMTDDTAEVLVAASSRVTNSAGAKQEPRTWRLSVSLQREGGQIKMSKVEFVP